jgi:hypothetical protein
LAVAGNEYVAWIGLNPSIADEQKLNRTLKKILGFTKHFSFQRFKMINLFALVSTDPQVMLKHVDPVGPNPAGPMLMEVPYLGFLFRCYSVPQSPDTPPNIER